MGKDQSNTDSYTRAAGYGNDKEMRDIRTCGSSMTRREPSGCAVCCRDIMMSRERLEKRIMKE